MSLTSRPVSDDDLAAVAAFVARWDAHWFGAPERDEAEIAEELDLATHRLLVHDGDEIAGLAWWIGTDAGLYVRPGDTGDVRGVLLDWLESSGSPAAVVLDRDLDTRGELARRNWAYSHSSFELIRAHTDDWVLDEPVRPDGVEFGGLDAVDADAIHHLVYVDARWADVPDHVERDLEQWRSIFLTDSALEHPQLVARRDGRPVGVALGRIFSDGTGWVAQLAVAADERGHGLGRALLLESLRRHRSAGAQRSGLAVQGANRDALRLYESVGLQIEREWQVYRRPISGQTPGARPPRTQPPETQQPREE